MAELNEVQTQVKADIIAMMLNSSLTEQFYEGVLFRLDSLGYSVVAGDSWMLGFSIQKVENTIKNSCNTVSIPEGLYHIAIDRVCGEFLFAKKQSGQLGEGFDFEAAVKQIQEGDTNVTFALGSGSMTPEQRFEALLAYLMQKGQSEFVTYRCIRW